jgi:hypothetical protein
VIPVRPGHRPAARRGYAGRVLRALVDWWDGVELWLTSLAFPLQVLLAVLVLMPGCWLAAAVVDNGVGWVMGAVTKRSGGRRQGP